MKAKKLLKKTREKKLSVAQQVLLNIEEGKPLMNKSQKLLSLTKKNEIATGLLQDFADKSGKSIQAVKDLFNKIEGGVADNVDKAKDPDKFHRIVMAQVKKSLGIN